MAVWLTLLILAVFEFDGFKSLPLTTLKDWQTLVMIVLFAFTYSFGIVIDRLADSLFVPWDTRIKNKQFARFKLPFVIMRAEVSKDNEGLREIFEYSRSRIRLARASALNFGLITIVGLLFTTIRVQTHKSTIFIFAIVFGVLFTYITICSWYTLTVAYCNMVSGSYDLQRKESNKA